MANLTKIIEEETTHMVQDAKDAVPERVKEALPYKVYNEKIAAEQNVADKALGPLTLLGPHVGVVDSNGKSKLEQIIDIVNLLNDGNDDFLILERSDQHFMQAVVGGPDSFILEFREGSADKHYQCKVSKSVLLDAFSSYADGNNSWRSICEWEIGNY